MLAQALQIALAFELVKYWLLLFVSTLAQTERNKISYVLKASGVHIVPTDDIIPRYNGS